MKYRTKLKRFQINSHNYVKKKYKFGIHVYYNVCKKEQISKENDFFWHNL